MVIIIFTLDEVKRNKGFCAFHLNIRSLLPKLEEFKHYFLDGSIEVIGISETWLHSKIETALVQVEGYQMIRQDRNHLTGKRGGGLCLYVKDSLTVENLDLNVNNHNLELLGIKIVQPNQKDLIILLVYRPPTGEIDYFCDKLKEIVQSLPNKDELIIMGDFNVDYLGKKKPSHK